MNYIQVILKNGKEKSLLRKHPWVFSGAVQSMSKQPENGDLVEVTDFNKNHLGFGHYQNGSICVRIISFENQSIDQNFWNIAIEKALQLRLKILLKGNSNTNVFRLIHGEGDGLPGLIIDYYNGVFVLQCHSIGMYKSRKEITEAILKLSDINITAIYDKSQETLSKETEAVNQYLYGNIENGEIEVLENRNRFIINWISGQKTGFFIDQRDNRQLLTRYCIDKKILNTFCYSGGFSVYALNHGAKLVHSLDSSAKAIDLVEKNIALINQKAKHLSICSDTIPYLKTMTEDYDIIILDPPAYAKHLSAKKNAINGYRRLNEEALRKIKSGGIIFTFSCSQAIDMNAFTSAVFSAAVNAGREVKILHRLHQPADHPISIYHPEGEYLKGLVLAVF